MAGRICARTLEGSNRSAADDALDLVRMDDDGEGWRSRDRRPNGSPPGG